MAFNYSSKKQGQQKAASGQRAQGRQQKAAVSNKKAERDPNKVYPVANLALSYPDSDEMIYPTGLFENTSKKGLVYLGGRISEDITIPAGTYVSVFMNEEETAEA